LRAAVRTNRGQPSVVDICHEASVSRGTFYRYFNEAGQLDRAMAAAVAAGLVADVSDAANKAFRSARDPGILVADALTRHFTGSEPIAELLRRRPNAGLALVASALPDAAAAVATAIGPYRDGSSADTVAHATMLVRMAATAAVSPWAGDRGLLRRAAQLGIGRHQSRASARAS
jgi:AcrR family transcriptional regulator